MKNNKLFRVKIKRLENICKVKETIKNEDIHLCRKQIKLLDINAK